MEVIKNPHLPENKVKSVICGNNGLIAPLLRKNGAEAIIVSDDKRLPTAVSNHADIQCCHLGDIILTTNSCLIGAVDGYDIRIIDEIPGNEYPKDCLLNCFILNNILITGKNCSRSVLEYAEMNSLEVRFVNQGYAKCSTAIISDTAVITADKTIAKALENDCSVLMIDSGHIRLTGYNYGFIGGTCGKLAADELAFAGNPYRHPCGRQIVSFTEMNNCGVNSLCDGELIDFGGFIPLFQ